MAWMKSLSFPFHPSLNACVAFSSLVPSYPMVLEIDKRHQEISQVLHLLPSNSKRVNFKAFMNKNITNPQKIIINN